VWRKSYALAKSVYVQTRTFPKDELYGLTSQMRRAAVSIPCNLAEGAGRQTDGDFKRFIAIARGSLAELQTLVALALDFDYLQPVQAEELQAQMEEVARMLHGLGRSVTRGPQ
jgi:four helix bundle protein